MGPEVVALLRRTSCVLFLSFTDLPAAGMGGEELVAIAVMRVVPVEFMWSHIGPFPTAFRTWFIPKTIYARATDPECSRSNRSHHTYLISWSLVASAMSPAAKRTRELQLLFRSTLSRTLIGAYSVPRWYEV